MQYGKMIGSWVTGNTHVELGEIKTFDHNNLQIISSVQDIPLFGLEVGQEGILTIWEPVEGQNADYTMTKASMKLVMT